MFEGEMLVADEQEAEIKLFPVVKVVLINNSGIKTKTGELVKPFCGPGMVKLLRAIDETGNVKEACKKAGVCYNKAWKLLNRFEEWAGYKITYRQRGGVNGGGLTRLTEEGTAFLMKHQEFQENCTHTVHEIFVKYFGDTLLSDKSSMVQPDFPQGTSKQAASVQEESPLKTSAFYKIARVNVSDFINDCCIRDATALCRIKELFNAFQNWCAVNNKHPAGRHVFNACLADLGISQIHTVNARLWAGIAIRGAET
ncbi:MAG: LysR family transcriptional regulator [Treponema sp.]|jgi:molybdate transport system regulatory protein|nr:LysR family transcriptional regulator [Treponema sp.]